jgi:hypothetical protein
LTGKNQIFLKIFRSGDFMNPRMGQKNGNFEFVSRETASG